jgi:hypothetical protein
MAKAKWMERAWVSLMTKKFEHERQRRRVPELKKAPQQGHEKKHCLGDAAVRGAATAVHLGDHLFQFFLGQEIFLLFRHSRCPW